MRKELPDRLALICPAFPATGRTVEDGILYVHSVMWTRTEFAPERRLQNPMVRAAFDYAGDPTAADLHLDTVRLGPAALLARLQWLWDAGVRTVCCDAVTPDDLSVLAQVILRQPSWFLPVGSAGLAGALAAQIEIQETESPEWPRELFRQGPVVVVVGSLHTASRRQADFLARYPEVLRIIADGSHLQSRAVAEATAQFFPKAMAEGRRVLLIQTPDRRLEARPEQVALQLAKTVLIALSRPGVSPGLIVTGGDTAWAICRELGAHGLWIHDEVEPGIAAGRLLCAADLLDKDREDVPLRDMQPLITKAGGFGDEALLARLVGLV
jgi:uncharacterized protein YgbK (DUF1537 family)